MGIRDLIRLRSKRRWRQWRAFRKRHELKAVNDRTKAIRPGDLLVFCTLRNERVRLPYFLRYYRDLGVNHFIVVDNDGGDGGREYLTDQPDVSVWTTKGSYRKSRFGVDWLNWLARRHGVGHWCLTVDVDEFLVYPFCDARPLRALTDWLESSQLRAFPAMILDMYPKGDMEAQPYREGQDPIEIAQYFDSGNYSIHRNWYLQNLWIQGGPRMRMFFADKPWEAPALNKIPLVKWERGFVYVDSTHMILPRGLNRVYDEWGGEMASGCLLHAKFLDTFAVKAAEEMLRGQHYANSTEYKAYHEKAGEKPDLWCKASERYINWRQLEILGLMSKGNWA